MPDVELAAEARTTSTELPARRKLALLKLPPSARFTVLADMTLGDDNDAVPSAAAAVDARLRNVAVLSVYPNGDAVKERSGVDATLQIEKKINKKINRTYTRT